MTEPVQPSRQSQEMLGSLQKAVTEALEKKQRLGQYAVLWKDGRPVIEGVEETAVSPQTIAGKS